VLCVGLAAAAIGSAALVTADAHADTFRPEFVVGTQLTAKKNHSLSAPIKAGAKGKVTKVYNSNGKIIALDVLIGTVKSVKVPVATVRANYDYLKL
jgi:hypothetical protein